MARTDRPLPGWAGPLVMLAAGSAIVWLELRHSRRGAGREAKAVRNARNLAIAAAAALPMRLIEAPLTARLARGAGRMGLVPRLTGHPVAGTVLAMVLLDYTLYVWHVLTHRVPLLWRFHLVHHVDLDMDASTALRFHFGEMTLSIPWRLAQVLAIGPTPLALSLWETLLFVSVLFHHSDLRLPAKLERSLGRLIVTPGMHDIHHRADPGSLHSNWSSGLSIWDRLHGTFRSGESRAPVGVPGFSDPERLTLLQCLRLPFEVTSEHATSLPSDNSVPGPGGEPSA